jgi:hypothetical protein
MLWLLLTKIMALQEYRITPSYELFLSFGGPDSVDHRTL